MHSRRSSSAHHPLCFCSALLLCSPAHPVLYSLHIKHCHQPPSPIPIPLLHLTCFVPSLVFCLAICTADAALRTKSGPTSLLHLTLHHWLALRHSSYCCEDPLAVFFPWRIANWNTAAVSTFTLHPLQPGPLARHTLLPRDRPRLLWIRTAIASPTYPHSCPL